MSAKNLSRKVIAIDGPAASGKGTIARFLAKELSFAYIDSGLFYRYVAFFRQDNSTQNSTSFSDDFFDVLIDYCKTGNDKNNIIHLLKSETCASSASQVSVEPAVREFVTNTIASLKYDLVIDGRDTTTVIFPNADVKFFVTANPEIRARRRMIELNEHESTFQYYLKNIVYRDNRDTERSIAPLVKAKDAILIDTSNMSIQSACSYALNHVINLVR